jgi:hypothetical protein
VTAVSARHAGGTTNGAQTPFIDPTRLRLGLLNEGYMPTPVCPPGCNHIDRKGKPCGSGGKAVHISAWTKGNFTARDVRGWESSRPQDSNTGLLCGEMVGVDGDILDSILAARVDALAEEHLGSTPLRRIGRAPKWLRCYRAETPMPKLETPERRLNGEIIQVEIMGKGQQVAAYGVHPVTMQPYTWIDREPLDVPLAELPVVFEGQIRAFLAATDALFVRAGAELTVPPKAAAAGPYVNGFRNVNQASLANIRPWFTAIFPTAAQEASGAWRVSSADLGRSLEEDLSMHPTSGGQDFGTREPLSPISTVARWGGAADAKAAAHWLCEQLGKNPAALGWKEAKEPPKVKIPPPEPGNPEYPLLDADAFMATFTNPDYLVDGIIQRARVHALTSMTGHGKTALALYLACSIAKGWNIGNLEVVQGEVIFLAGENPDDLCGRFFAACQHYGITPASLRIRVMPGNFPMDAETAETLKRQIDETDRPPALIIADSAAAYFPGDDENQNVQMGAFARNLRALTRCRGNPAVLILCHPVKNAGKENLIPRGGGAFLNEIDANLTLWADAQETTSLHWQGKIRGADFQPVNFCLRQVKIAEKTDAKGRPFVSIVAALQTEEQAEKSVAQAATDENTVLERLRRNPGISVANIALNVGWVSDSGVPSKSKVHRLLKSLERLKLTKSWRGKWQITDAGKAELSGAQHGNGLAES